MRIYNRICNKKLHENIQDLIVRESLGANYKHLYRFVLYQKFSEDAQLLLVNSISNTLDNDYLVFFDFVRNPWIDEPAQLLISDVCKNWLYFGNPKLKSAARVALCYILDNRYLSSETFKNVEEIIRLCPDKSYLVNCGTDFAYMVYAKLSISKSLHAETQVHIAKSGYFGAALNLTKNTSLYGDVQLLLLDEDFGNQNFNESIIYNLSANESLTDAAENKITGILDKHSAEFKKKYLKKNEE